MKYKFKFEFKTGATSCLFAADETTRNKYGPCVELSLLPIEPMLKKFALDWIQKVRTEGQTEENKKAATELMRRLKKNLGSDYSIE